MVSKLYELKISQPNLQYLFEQKMFKYVSAAAMTIMILDPDRYYNEMCCK